MLRDCFSPEIARLLAEDEWLVAETRYDPAENLAFEAVFGLANGRMGSRAAHEEGGVRRTLPANYVHGVFDRSEAFMRELCNTPDWTKLRITCSLEPIGVESGTLTEYLRVLDMRSGLVVKRYVTLGAFGGHTRVEIVKFLSRAHPRRGLLRLWVTPLDYRGILEFENIVDGTVTNFMDFPRFRVKHLKTREVSDLDGLGCYIESETRDHGLPVGTGAALSMRCEGREAPMRSRAFRPYGEVASEFADAALEAGETLVVDKYAAVATGRDCEGVRAQVKREIEDALNRGFEQELAMHSALVRAMWARADMRVTGDDPLTKALRFNIFHLMSTPDPSDSRVNVGAKLLHGEEYGGHAFWDTELFVLPFFDYVFPETARRLAEYRYLTLGKALENARANGYAGAKYPWESADTGEEECPSWTIDYDGTCYRCYVADYEHHVTADIAYGLNHYFEITGDWDFMERMGAEILLETARFWASRMTWNEKMARYEILRVTGPDEWHEPVDNNAYTNHLARWNILKAVEVLRRLETENPDAARRLRARLRLTDGEIENWRTRADRLFLQAERGLIEQFDGFFQIPDAVVTEWDDKGMPRMPASQAGKRGMARCVLKQADVVMLLFLLSELFDPETRRVNFDYYEKRTLHRSSLSPSIHCMMGLRVGDDRRAYQYLERSAYVDIRNVQGNTREGLHAASAGGTWQCVALGYAGLRVEADGVLAFEPRLPERWSAVEFGIHRGGQTLRITVSREDVSIVSDAEPVVYRVNGAARQSRVAR